MSLIRRVFPTDQSPDVHDADSTDPSSVTSSISSGGTGSLLPSILITVSIGVSGFPPVVEDIDVFDAAKSTIIRDCIHLRNLLWRGLGEEEFHLNEGLILTSDQEGWRQDHSY